jgi:hypothetical protein
MNKTHEGGEVGEELEPLELPMANILFRVPQGAVTEGGTGDKLRGSPDVESKGGFGAQSCEASRE